MDADTKKTVMAALMWFMIPAAAIAALSGNMHLAAACVLTALLIWVYGEVKKIEANIIKPAGKFADFLKATAEIGGFTRCAELGEGAVGEAAKSYNALMEKLEAKQDGLKLERGRLEADNAALREEAERLRERERGLVDHVTGLPNRAAFERRVGEALAQGQEGGIVFVDLNNFLFISKILGRESGHRLLHEVGERLSGITVVKNFCARYIGDKFTVLVHGGRGDIEIYCRYLCRQFELPFTPGEAVIKMEAGIGAAVLRGGGEGGAVEDALLAMRRSREAGLGYYFFDDALRGKLKRQEQVLDILRDSILQNEVFLVYQPQLELNTDRVTALEALMRLKNKELGYISPAEFIPIAEANGLMLELGYWAVEEACGLISRSSYAGIVAVNVSAIQIFDSLFAEKVTEIITRSGIDPKRLMLEVKEHFAAGVFERELPKLNGLRRMGVAIAVDNFGTVYSSLNQMASLPIDTVKIDRSFIYGIFTDDRKRIIVRSIIDTAHTLGLSVVAEGVEDDEQRRFLQESGCDMIQGYVFSAPLEEEGLEELAGRNAGHRARGKMYE